MNFRCCRAATASRRPTPSSRHPVADKLTDSLFRPEAIEAGRGAQLGSILRDQPLTLRLLTVAAVLSAMALVFFLAQGSYTRRTRVIGQLTPRNGVATALAPLSGVVVQVPVVEGARVAPGALLALIRVPGASGAGDKVEALRANLSRRRTELLHGRTFAAERCMLRRRGLAAQLRQTLEELAIADAELETRQAQLHLSNDTLAQWRALEQQHFVSTLQLRQQQAAALAQQAELQALQRQRTAVARSLVQIRQSLAEWPAEQQAAIEPFDRELAAIERQRIDFESTHESAITAQVPGTVTSILVKAGESVQAGQQLLSVLPANPELQAELLLPSRAIGFVRPGATVQLRYQAFPYQKFGHHRGLVRQVSRNTLDPAQARALLGGLAINEPFYRVTVELTSQFIGAYGRAEPLKPGMLLEADITSDRRSLIEWLFEPWHALQSPLSGR